MTTILLGAATVDDVVQQWRDSSLYVLPAGQIPPNPSEILGSGADGDAFRPPDQGVRLVLVDSPPVLPVINAIVINKLVGGLLFVVAADRTRKRDLQSALKALTTVDAPAAGFALNMVAGGPADPYRYGYYRFQEGEETTRGGRRAKERARTR